MRNPVLPDLLLSVTETVHRAGRLLSSEWFRPGGPRGSGDKAEIDVDIEQRLRVELLSLLAGDFWGEETGHRLSGDAWCWVVDPNDGTQDFLSGIPGSAVAVGLLHDGVPVLGVVHAPVTADGQFDTIGWAQGMAHLTRNGRAIEVDLSRQMLSVHSAVMVSTAARHKPETNRALCAPGHCVPMPSIAYRLARVAAGDGVCGVSLCPVSAHDLVAGHALLLGAKGVLIDEQGEAIVYPSEARMLAASQRCFGGAPAVCSVLVRRDWNIVFEPYSL